MAVCQEIMRDASALKDKACKIETTLHYAHAALEEANETLAPFVEDEAAPNGELGDEGETAEEPDGGTI